MPSGSFCAPCSQTIRTLTFGLAPGDSGTSPCTATRMTSTSCSWPCFSSVAVNPFTSRVYRLRHSSSIPTGFVRASSANFSAGVSGALLSMNSGSGLGGGWGVVHSHS